MKADWKTDQTKTHTLLTLVINQITYWSGAQSHSDRMGVQGFLISCGSSINSQHWSRQSTGRSLWQSESSLQLKPAIQVQHLHILMRSFSSILQDNLIFQIQSPLLNSISDQTFCYERAFIPTEELGFNTVQHSERHHNPELLSKAIPLQI